MSVKMRMPKLTESLSAPLQTDTKPYLIKPVPIGNRELLKLVGGTVAVNQLVNGAGTVTVTNNHKYVSHIGSTWSIAISNGSAISVGASDLVTDLTQMFGSTIADYAYTLETGETGAGVAWLQSFGFFNKDFLPFDAGSLLSVKTSGHVTVGLNQWDEVWEVGNIGNTGANYNDASNIRSKNYVPVLPNTQYYLNVPSQVNMAWYDGNKNFLRMTYPQRGAFTVASDVAYIRFATRTYGSTYNNDICINLSSSKNGTYEPYKKTEYPLSDVELRGVPKLVSGAIEYDGDTYESDGTVTRKYGIVDLGTLNWTYYTGSTNPIFYGDISNGKTYASSAPVGIICSKYRTLNTATGADPFSKVEDKLIGVNGQPALSATRLLVRDTAYSTAAAFKTAMSGVYLVYELATPTTETADPYESPQIVETGGTESFIDERTVPMPVGNVSEYCEAVKSVSIGMRMGKGLSVKMRMGGEL